MHAAQAGRTAHAHASIMIAFISIIHHTLPEPCLQLVDKLRSYQNRRSLFSLLDM